MVSGPSGYDQTILQTGTLGTLLQDFQIWASRNVLKTDLKIVQDVSHHVQICPSLCQCVLFGANVSHLGPNLTP